MTDWKRQRRRSINNRELLLAVSDNDFEEINRLIHDYVDVNFTDQNGFTALHFAAESADSKVVELLINAGAIVDNKNNNQETPLDIAKRLNRDEIVKTLEASANQISESKSDVLKVPANSQNQQVVASNGVAIANGVATTNGFHKKKHEVWINPINAYIYQLKILMLFLYRGIACQYSFRLGVDIEEPRKFDDLVFEITQDNTQVYRFLQAKHNIDETKKITVDKLLSEISGDYSLIKYFLSYQTSKRENLFKDGVIKDVTVCTNIDFDYQNLNEAQIEIQRVDEKDEILDVEVDGKQPMKYKFTSSILPKLLAKLKQCGLSSKNTSENEVKDFLEHLMFAVNQPNEEELDNIVKNELSREFQFITTEDACNKFFVRMLEWMKSKDRDSFWSCNEAKDFLDEVIKEIPIWYDVQSPVESFTGRVEQLDKMHKILQTRSKTMICVSGPGGVGKSELVKKYIFKHSQCYDDKVVWINAENYQTLVNSFRNLACDKLGISRINTDGKDKEIKSIVMEIYQYFSKGKSLFIFDNSEMYQSQAKFDSGIERFLPSLPQNCKKPHVIITSRNQKWPKSIKVLALEAFSEQEAALFVSYSLQLKNNDQKEKIKQLGKKLQLMPLAMQQAVAYIKAQNDKIDSNFRISNYLERHSEKSRELLNFKVSEDCDSKYARIVLTTWNVSLDAIQERKDGHDALNIMNILAYLLPDNIPLDILLMFMNDKQRLASAIELLKQYSLIDVQHKIFNVHRLVQQVIRMKLLESNNEQLVLTEILKAVEITKIDSRNVDHFVSLWNHSKNYAELADQFYEISGRIAKVVMSRDRPKEARPMANGARKRKQQSSRDREIELKALDKKTLLAGALLDKGHCFEALKEFERIYEIQKALRGANTRETLASKRNMAFALYRLGKRDEAFKCYNEILKDSTVYFGENDPDTLATRNNIAAFLIDEEKYEEALLIFQEIYNIQKQIYSEEDNVVLITKNNIANVLCKLNKTEEAMKIWQDIYNIQKKSLAEDHPDMMITRSSIANVLFERGKYADALEIYEDLFRIKSRVLGEDHPEVVDIRVDIACTLKVQGKFDEALIILHELLKKQIGDSGLYNRHVPKTLHAIASVLHEQENYPEALKTYQDLLSCQITMLGRDDMKTVNTRGFIADILTKQARFDEALDYYQEMFSITKNSLGMDHRTTLAAKHGIGVIYLCKRDYDKAWHTLSEVLVAQEALLGKDHMDYKATLKNLAVISAQKEKLGSHSTNMKPLKPNDPLTAIINNDMVLLKKLVKEGKNVNAEDENSWTLLHHAVNLNQPSTMKFLLANGADITRTTNRGETPLHIAASKGHLAIVKTLLEQPTYSELKSYINALTYTENTALHLAVVNGFFEVAMHLLVRGARYDLQNQNDQYPVDLAVDRYLSGLLKKVHLYNKFAKIGIDEMYGQLQHHSYEEYLSVANARGSEGHTMLSVAVINKRENITKLLVKLRVDKTYCNHSMTVYNSNLNELLAHASIAQATLKNASSSLRTVVADVSDLVSVFRTHDKSTADSNIIVVEDMLELLETRKDAKSFLELAKFVISKHLLLFARSIYTVQLYEAAKCNVLDTVRELVPRNIDVDVRDNGGWTPLHYAVNVGNERMVELLLARGAEVNVITNMGKFTPLHIAVNKGNATIAELLLSRDSRSEFIDAKTEAKGSTALHIAVKFGQTAIVTHLLTRGASYSIKNKDGQSPMDLAEEQTIRDLFKLIDELFADAENGKADFIRKLKALGPSGIKTVIRVRNDEGFSMTEVAALKDHRELASQILDMVKTMFYLPDDVLLTDLAK